MVILHLFVCLLIVLSPFMHLFVFVSHLSVVFLCLFVVNWRLFNVIQLLFSLTFCRWSPSVPSDHYTSAQWVCSVIHSWSCPAALMLPVIHRFPHICVVLYKLLIKGRSHLNNPLFPLYTSWDYISFSCTVAYVTLIHCVSPALSPRISVNKAGEYLISLVL